MYIIGHLILSEMLNFIKVLNFYQVMNFLNH